MKHARSSNIANLGFLLILFMQLVSNKYLKAFFISKCMATYRCVEKGRSIEGDSLRRISNGERKLSVVIPTYNEECISKLVDAIEDNLRKTSMKDNYEIIIVDDGSKDKTPAIMDELAKDRKRNVVALHRKGIRGLFSAVRDGISIANGKHILTMDADFSHPPEIIPKMLSHADKHDIVSGSRFVKGGKMEGGFIP